MESFRKVPFFFLFRSTDLRDNIYYKKYYVFWSKFILIEFIPYAAIIVFNALILAKTVKGTYSNDVRAERGWKGGGDPKADEIREVSWIL